MRKKAVSDSPESPAFSKSFGARHAPEERNDGTAAFSLGYLGSGMWRTGRAPRHLILSIIPRMRGCILHRYDVSHIILCSAAGPTAFGNRAPLLGLHSINNTGFRWEAVRTVSRGCDNRCVIAHATRVLFM